MAKRSSERPSNTSYSMLAQAQHRMRAQREKGNTSSPSPINSSAKLKSSLRASTSNNNVSMMHDYGYRRSQMSPIKRPSQTSPMKTTTTAKRPQSTYKTPSNAKRSSNQSYLNNSHNSYVQQNLNNSKIYQHHSSQNQYSRQ